MSTSVTRYGEILPVFKEPKQTMGSLAHMDSGNTLVIEQLVNIVDISLIVQQNQQNVGQLTIENVIAPSQSASTRVLIIWVAAGSSVSVVHGHGIMTQTGMNLMYTDAGTVELVYSGTVWLQV